MLYKRGWYVALVGEAEPGSTAGPDPDDSGGSQGQGQGEDELRLWFGICRQNVTPKTLLCHVEWLESIGLGEFRKSGIQDRVPADSILTRIIIKEKVDDDKPGDKKLLMPLKSLRIANQLFHEKTGIQLYPVSEEDDIKPGVNYERKRKSSPLVKEKKKKEKVSTLKKGKETKSKIKKEVKVKKLKEPAAKKPKIDKSNPNWKLKPNLSIKVYEKDPMFESLEEVPFVSSSAHSKLIIRAVNLNNNKLLNQYIKDTSNICSININRSMACQMNGMSHAVMNQDIESLKIFLKAENEMKNKTRCSQEACLLPVHSTGTYNYRSLGIRHVRKVNLSRGSREGNNAFTKDRNNMEGSSSINFGVLMGWNLSSKFVSSVETLTKTDLWQITGNVHKAMRTGNDELAAYYINKDINKKFSEQFSKFFLDALTGKGDPWDGKIREASARKKAYENRNVTTLHASCLNPDSGPLQALLQVCPDMYIVDDDGWKLIHYAAVARKSSALELLLARGVPTEDPEKNGLTALTLACKAGRFNNASLILQHNAKSDDDEESIMMKKYGRGQVNRAGKDSWTPIHLAVANSHLEVVKVLMNYSANANKPLNTKYDKMTPLMLAAANGDMSMVKYLVKFAKIENKDRFKRTALTHAIINGNAHVASYLLSLGSDANGVDSSGNSNLHYACAYGWWFCMKVLLDAGANPNAANEWKLTPLSAAFLKGNSGIGRYLSTLPGVDLEVKDDKGRTIILNMLTDNQEGLTTAKLDEIKAFVTEYKADPNCVDNDGKTALHYIASIKPQHNENRKIFFQNVKSLLLFFLEQNVSTIITDNLNLTPLQTALENKFVDDYNEPQTYPFTRIVMILKSMLKETKSGKYLSLVNARMLMKSFFNAIDIKYMKKFYEIYKSLMEIMTVIDNGNLTFLDEICDSGEGKMKVNWTVFSIICQVYSSLTAQPFNNEEKNKAKSLEQLLDIYTSFHAAVQPRLSFKINEKESFHCLLTTCTAKDDFKALHYLLEADNVDVNVVSHTGFDALYLLIQCGDVNVVKEILDRGAHINRIRDVKKDNKGKVSEQDTPLLFSITLGQSDIVELLLSKGSDVQTKQSTGVSAIHKATISYASKRVKSRFKVVQSLLKHGADINELDEKKRTPLHIAVNLSNDSSDFSMELEMLLLRRGACLAATDIRGRTPLHYAFVKIGQHDVITAIDPIQIVSALVENMSTQNITIKDTFGASALHYASLRGSTVCILLLLQKGGVIESRDKHNQTPICYAASGKHDGSALMLIQRDANLNVTMSKGHSLFEALLLNDWLGLTYIALNKMEKFGMKYVDAIEVALHLQKLQFAKTLINKVVDQSKLLEYGSQRRNLMSVFAYETKRSTMNAGHENIDDLYELMVSAGVKTSEIDNHGCNPLHYAFLNNNQILVSLLLKRESISKDLTTRTTTGRTMLAASFWCLLKLDSLDISNIEFLISLDIDVNEKFNVPHFTFATGNPNLRLTRENFVQSDEGSNEDVSLTALHLAVLKEDKILIKSLLRLSADTSIEDSRGLSPLSYALKTNNEEVFNLLLKNESSVVDFNVLKHAIVLDLEIDSSPSFDNEKLFQKLYKTLPLDDNSAVELQNLAFKHGAISILKSINKKYSFDGNLKHTNGIAMNVDQVNFDNDSQNMLKKINSNLKPEDNPMKKVSPPTGCVVKEGKIFNNCDILMNKVDVNCGRWGMYNFYRMQIWKDDYKDLWILFTNWGRIERWGSGQYQNTPFSKPEEAEDEFRKIFKAKSGNDWDDLDKFENKNGKYRLVKKELINRVKREDIYFDLKTSQDYELPDDIAYLVKDISSIGMIKTAFSSFGKVDTDSMPFGRIDRECLLKARSILLDILEPSVKAREKIAHSVENSGSVKFQDLMQKISTYSSEYFFLVPSDGYAYEKVPPIEHEWDLKEQKQRLEYLLDMSYTEKLLLGAMYKRMEIHPLDYIYSGLQCNLKQLDLKGLEAKLIKKYMDQSKGSKKYKVWSIFSTTDKVDDKMKTLNKKLLWHGTSRCHMMSILHNGLVIQAAYSHKSGSAYGDGIYLADVFDKSISYSDRKGNRYMLLCEVDLSKCIPYKHHNDKNVFCTKVNGKHEPHQQGELTTAFGYKIPTGRISPRKQAPGEEFTWNEYNEYVVYDASLVRVRYVVCLKDATNKEDITKEKIIEAFKIDGSMTGPIDDNEANDSDESDEGDVSDHEDSNDSDSS